MGGKDGSLSRKTIEKYSFQQIRHVYSIRKAFKQFPRYDACVSLVKTTRLGENAAQLILSLVDARAQRAVLLDFLLSGGTEAEMLGSPAGSSGLQVERVRFLVF